jgi:ABC-type lipoprotein release transport system permease subunit
MDSHHTMKRQLALIRFALGSSRRRWGRTLALGVALALVTFGFASVLFLTEALRREFHLGAAALPDLTVQRLVAGRPTLIPEEWKAQIADLAGVTKVEPRVWGYYFVPALSGNFTVVGTICDPERRPTDATHVVSEGRFPQGGSTGEILLGEGLAGFLGLGVGDGMVLPVGTGSMELKVVGLFRSSVALWTADVMLMSLEDARRFLDVPAGMATDLAVQLSTPDEASVAARKIAERLPGARILDRQLMNRAYDLSFDTRGGILGAMLLPALIAFLVLAWDRLTGVGPGERREIGALKAIGWQTGDVLLARLWENLLTGLEGALAGLVMAYAYVFPAQAPGLAEVLFGWSAVYPAFHPAPAVTGGQLLVLAVLVVVPFVAASLVPAWRASTYDPLSLIRGVA